MDAVDDSRCAAYIDPFVTRTNEEIMAKKKTAPKTAAPPKKAAKPKPAKTPAGKKKAPPKKAAAPVEEMLDPMEEKALDLVQSSKSLCRELEEAVTAAIAEGLQKVFQQHQVELTSDQARNIAMILFGDD
jgi:hypothetical protein